MARLVLTSQSDDACGGPGTGSASHRYLRSNTRGHLGRWDCFLKSAQPCWNQRKERGASQTKWGALAGWSRAVWARGCSAPGVTHHGSETSIVLLSATSWLEQLACRHPTPGRTRTHSRLESCESRRSYPAISGPPPPLS